MLACLIGIYDSGGSTHLERISDDPPTLHCGSVLSCNRRSKPQGWWRFACLVGAYDRDGSTHLFESISEAIQLGRVVQLCTMGESSRPSIDRSHRVGGSWFALLVHAIVTGDGSVSRFRLHCASVRAHQNWSHHAQWAITLVIKEIILQSITFNFVVFQLLCQSYSLLISREKA